MAELCAREAYRIWAPSYSAETAISLLEDGLVSAMTPPLGDKRLLDAGCGTGRRLLGSGAARALGVDLCPEMLEAGAAAEDLPPGYTFTVGDVLDLPVPDQAFDVVWCRLVLGHVNDLGKAYAGLARAADAGAKIIVSDFHPSAWRAGHRRSFRSGKEIFEIEHHIHEPGTHCEAATAAGLQMLDMREAAIGPEVRRFYADAGQLDRFENDTGLPVVLAIAFGRRD